MRGRSDGPIVPPWFRSRLEALTPKEDNTMGLFVFDRLTSVFRLRHTIPLQIIYRLDKTPVNLLPQKTTFVVFIESYFTKETVVVRNLSVILLYSHTLINKPTPLYPLL